MKINAIVAIGDENQIALDNKLPWHYPEDLKHFKEKVKDKTIILGRKTYESMPKSFFKTVTPIIVSTTIDCDEHLAESLDEALAIARDMDESEVWICGGVSIYKEAIERKLINSLHVSHIQYTGPADRYFPQFYSLIEGVSDGETIYSEKNQKPFRYKVYELESENEWTSPIEHRSGFMRIEDGTGWHNHSSNNITLEYRPDPITGLMEAHTTALNWTSGPSTAIGSTWVHADGSILSVTDNGTITVGAMDWNQQTPYEELLRTYERVVGDHETQIIDIDMAMEVKHELEAALRQTDPSSTITVDWQMTRSATPVYTLGRAEAVEVIGGGMTLSFTLNGMFRGSAFSNLQFNIGA
jgi:dihydrofolate reductase